MEVTRSNFYSLLPELKKAVTKADFITFDGEFTGLNSGGRELEFKPFDTPEQYYTKLRQGAFDFLLVQFGVCIFQYNEKLERYTHQAYNFYLFPSLKSNSVFLCQSSSIDFLASQGFDFNKVFREGIPYLTQVEEDKMRLIIEKRQKKNTNDSSRESQGQDIPIPEEQKAYLKDICSQVKSFLDDSKEEEIVINKCNGWIRRLLFQELSKKFGDSVYLKTRVTPKKDFVLVVMRGGDAEMQKHREEDEKKLEWKELDDAVGFSHFIRHVSQSGKVIVGHNCLLDLCHMMNHFCYPLPNGYEEFKEIMSHTFPSIIDTKIVANAPCFREQIQSTVLGHLLERLSEKPFEMPVVDVEVEGRGYNMSVDKAHEAGYDAYITGLCFLSLCQQLARNAGRTLKSLDKINDLLQQFLNRLYLMKLQDMPFIHLGAPDPKPPRNHVFHLRFPREWTRDEVQELFKPFGPVFISFLDERSAFVALQRKDQAKGVLKTMVESNIYKLTSFFQFQKQLKMSRKSPPPPSKYSTPNSPSVESVRKRKGLELSSDSEPNTAVSVHKKRCSIEQRYRPAELLSTTYLLGILMSRYHLDWLERPVRFVASNVFAVIIKMIISLALMSSICYVIWFVSGSWQMKGGRKGHF